MFTWFHYFPHTYSSYFVLFFSWTPSLTEQQEKAMRAQIFMTMSSFSLWGLKTSMWWGKAYRNLLKVLYCTRNTSFFFPEGFNLFTPKLKKFILPVVFHLSKLWKAKFFILCVAIIYLVRLQGKFNIDHSWEWKVLVDVGWSIVFMSQVFGWSLLLLGALCFFFCVCVCLLFYLVGCEASRNSVSAFLSGQESSGWTKHIKAILDTSVFIVKVKHERTFIK